jgi:hypothetical protein
MGCDGLGVFDLELSPPLTDEEDFLCIRAHAEQSFRLDMLFALKIAKPLFDLLNERLRPWGVETVSDLARAFGGFVFNDNTSIFRIYASSSQAVLVTPFDLKPRFLKKIFDELIAPVTHVLFRVGRTSERVHLGRDHCGLLGNESF